MNNGDNHSNLSNANTFFYRNGSKPEQNGSTNLTLDRIAPVKNSHILTPNQDAKPSQSEEWSHVTRDLLDSLPKVWSRGLLYLLVISTTLLLPWAMLSKVEETGSARGRLEPQGKTLHLDAPVAGTVASVKVEEGSSVKAGQVLLEMESDVVRADLQQAESQQAGLLNRLTQLEVMRNQLVVLTRTQQLQNQAQATAQQAQIDQTAQELSFNQSAYQLNQDLLAKNRSTVERFRQAQQEGVVSLLQLEEVEHALIDSQKVLQQNHSEIQQSQAELTRQQSTYEGLIRQGEVAILENQKQIEELQSQVADTQTELAKTKTQIQSLKFQLQQRVLYAPMDGVLFQLPIKGAGAVVQPGDLVAEIAPKGATLILKAQMPSRDSGFLQVGMPAKIKFDAYPFQDYGIVNGYVNWVSPDSRIVETPQGNVEMYELKIAIDRPYLQTGNQRISFTPGQTATAEVIIRERRVIDFILDPIKKLQQSGLEL